MRHFRNDFLSPRNVTTFSVKLWAVLQFCVHGMSGTFLFRVNIRSSFLVPVMWPTEWRHRSLGHDACRSGQYRYHAIRSSRAPPLAPAPCRVPITSPRLVTAEQSNLVKLTATYCIPARFWPWVATPQTTWCIYALTGISVSHIFTLPCTDRKWLP